ncbi:MAG: hypothetical protein MPJ06_08100, partial [Nitrosopumilus sp.]|nr:hypothetical protein [Nitrosopumilus sp.]MDA7943942.1 hypothetical protein [Nitrosopumilus sp.]MDA7999069.1 hypothetical protein [Nitrosopumilus sp.]
SAAFDFNGAIRRGGMRPAGICMILLGAWFAWDGLHLVADRGAAAASGMPADWPLLGVGAAIASPGIAAAATGARAAFLGRGGRMAGAGMVVLGAWLGLWGAYLAGALAAGTGPAPGAAEAAAVTALVPAAVIAAAGIRMILGAGAWRHAGGGLALAGAWFVSAWTYMALAEGAEGDAGAPLLGAALLAAGLLAARGRGWRPLAAPRGPRSQRF